MALQLPRLPSNQKLVDLASGNPTMVFSRWWQSVVESIEASINAIAAALAAAVAAQATADSAQDQAIAAALDAAAAATAAGNAATAAAVAQTTANGKLDQAAADARYVRQRVGPIWSSPTGTADRSSFATYTSPTISNPPTQAEVQAVSDAVQSVSQHLKALVDDLRSNGVLT